MTALNWEKDRAKQLTKEYAFDDLPSTGSYWDQVRCGARPGKRNPGNHTSHASARSEAQVKNRFDDFQQLNVYLTHALHPDFKKKLQCQKTETIQIVRKLIARCDAWGQRSNSAEQTLLNKARSTVNQYSH
jgi:hypothetical protein